MSGLRDLAAQATPGPWAEYEYSDDSLYIESIHETFGENREYVLELRPNTGTKDADMRLILLAPDLAVLCADMADALAGIRNSTPDIYVRETARTLLARFAALNTQAGGEA